MTKMLSSMSKNRASGSDGMALSRRRAVTVDPIRDPRWTELLHRYRGGLFNSPPWLKALRDTYGFDVRADVLLDDAGRPTAGVAYATIRDVMDDRTVSLPFSDYCDPLVADPGDWEVLGGRLVAGGRRVHLRCLHNWVPLEDDHFATTGHARWHRVVLQPDPEDMWRALDGSARRAIRKARAQGVTVSIAQDEHELRAFFELHMRVRKHKYHLLAQPYRFFQALWDGFLRHGQGVLMLARLDGEIIGGVLFLGWGRELYYKFNASDPQHLDARPNDLIVWQALVHGVEQGYDALDFGLSSWNQEGLNRFKRKYATDERTIHLLRSTPCPDPSSAELEVRGLLDRLTSVLVDEQVPDRITEEAGDALYRYFV